MIMPTELKRALVEMAEVAAGPHGPHYDKPQMQRLRAIVADIAYKVDGSQFNPIYLAGIPCLVIKVPTPSLRDKAILGDLVSVLVFDAEFNGDFATLTDAEIAKMVVQRIAEGAIHEVYERFTYQGEHVIDPHPELVDA